MFYSRFFLLKCSRKEKLVWDNSLSTYSTPDDSSYVGRDTSSNRWGLLSLRSVKAESANRTEADFGKGMREFERVESLTALPVKDSVPIAFLVCKRGS